MPLTGGRAITHNDWVARPSEPGLKAAALFALCLLLAPTGAAETLPLPGPGEALVGQERSLPSRARDTLLDIGREHGYGYAELKIANPSVDPWLPGAGTAVLLPGRRILPDAGRKGIVINLPEMRLYYYPAVGPARATSYPIGIGKEGWQMPESATRVGAKERRPVWHVPESIRRERAAQGETLPAAVPPGPGNPLGEYALRLGRSSYLIHGSDKKYGIGMEVSHGCIRLAAGDIRQLYGQVAVGTPVRVVDQPYKAGVQAGTLYLEAHPPLPGRRHTTGLTAMVAAVIRAMGEAAYDVDWELALHVAQEAHGRPVAIGTLRKSLEP